MINNYLKIIYHVKARLLIIALGIVLVSPSLFSGFFADDFSQYVLVNEPNILHQTPRPTFFNLFSFFDNNPVKRQEQYSQSLIPWWSSPNFTLNFWRPVAEISHFVDYQYLKNSPVLMHLHSLLWYGLLLFLLTQFYNSLFADKVLALTALLLFVTDANHGVTVAWLANRNAIMAAVFALFAFNQYHAFRQSHHVRHLVLSSLALVLTFLSAEIGVSIGCFFLAYAIFMDFGKLVQRFIWLLPALIVFLLWAFFYHYFGFGVAGNKAYYINPFVSPDAFFQRFIYRYPTAFTIQFNLLPLHLLNMFKVALALLGCLIIAGLLMLAYKKQDKRFNFFLLVMALSILPITTAAMQERNMMFVGIAGAGLLAQIIVWLLEAVERNRQNKITWWLLTIILFFHVFLNALMMLPKSFTPYLFSQESIETAKNLPDDVTDKHVVTLGIPFFDACYFSAIRKVYGLPLPQRFWNVVTHTKDVGVRRLDEYTLEFSQPDGLLQKDDFLVRDIVSEPFFAGQLLSLDGVRVTVKVVNAEGAPTIMEWHFDKSLDDGNIELLFWDDRKLIPLDLKNNEGRQFK